MNPKLQLYLKDKLNEFSNVLSQVIDRKVIMNMDIFFQVLEL